MLFCSSAALLLLWTQPKAARSNPLPPESTIVNQTIVEAPPPINIPEEDNSNQIIREAPPLNSTSEGDTYNPILLETPPPNSTSTGVTDNQTILDIEAPAAIPTAASESTTSLDRESLTIEELSLALPTLGIPSIYLPEISKDIRLVLKLSERKVYVYQGEQEKASYPVAIGKSSTPTPTGTYQVFQMVVDPVWKSPWTGEVFPPGANSALGLRWIGFAELPNGIIGFHGTPTISSIGKAASNGCVRMHNEHVVELFEKVKMGTPVTVEN
ncbi:MAG: L,D-transpeptidase [Symploca sp. SIO2D2]|nr:L,D-transpeptidase [Symploca sp. SIO2D2]